MNIENKQLVASWAQFVALCVVFGTILMHMGKRDAEIQLTTDQVKALGDIVSDLASAQIGLTIRGEANDIRLRELIPRLERLERVSK